MVVGIEPHGERVCGARDGVRRLEHLSGIERMEVGIVVGEPLGELRQDRAHGFCGCLPLIE